MSNSRVAIKCWIEMQKVLLKRIQAAETPREADHTWFDKDLDEAFYTAIWVTKESIDTVEKELAVADKQFMAHGDNIPIFSEEAWGRVQSEIDRCSKAWANLSQKASATQKRCLELITLATMGCTTSSEMST